MRYRSAEAFRAALEQRLRSEAEARSVALMRLRKRVTFQRFLARLAAAAPGRWVLKGAFALDLRLGLRTRTTKDIDIARADEEPAATRDLMAAATIDLGEFFGFDVRRTPRLDDAAGFHAVRYTVAAELAGRRFEQFPVDVALSETPTMEPESLKAPDALAFAEIAPPDLPVVAIEQHVAEKVHAYSGCYGARQEGSSRTKDLVDLVLISDLAQLDAERLRHALRSTFEKRARQALPESLPPPPRQWARPYAEQAQEVGVPSELNAAYAHAAAFLDPILRGRAGGRWDPKQSRWGGRS